MLPVAMDGCLPVCVALGCGLPIRFGDAYAPFCCFECAETAHTEAADARRAAMREELRGRELAFQERDGLWRGEGR